VDEPQIVPGSSPIETWSRQVEGDVDYHCVQKCYPLIKFIPPPPPPPPPVMPQFEIVTLPPPSPPTMPPTTTTTPPPPPMLKLNRTAQVIVEEQSHIVEYIPEILTIGYFSKQCCYLSNCIVVGIQDECPNVCYEPCDAVCTGNCLVNPTCPGQCQEIYLLEQKYIEEYRMWLALKMNEIKLKYRQLYEECLLRTNQALTLEVSSLKTSAQGHLQLLQQFVQTKFEGGTFSESIPERFITVNTTKKGLLADEYYEDYEEESTESSEMEEYEDSDDMRRRGGRNYGIEINIEGQKNYGTGVGAGEGGAKSSYQVNQNIGINNHAANDENENESEMEIESPSPTAASAE
jgi:hypothetical protein